MAEEQRKQDLQANGMLFDSCQDNNCFSYTCPCPTDIDAMPATEAPLKKPKELQTRQPKGFNLNMYKMHSLDNYIDAIRQYGTTDSFSTQLVSGWFNL